MTADPFARFARLDPAQGDHPDWAVLDRALLDTIDARSTTMTISLTPNDIQPTSGPASRGGGRKRLTLVAATIAAVVLLIVALAISREDRDGVPADEREVPTGPTVPDDESGDASVPNPEAVAIASRFASTVGSGDLDAVLAMLSPESDCNVPVGRVAESCEQHWGYLLAIGTDLEVRRCDDAVPARCALDFRSALHAEMGMPDYSLPGYVFVVDADTVISDFTEIPISRAYMGTLAAGARLWSHLGAMRPDLDVDNTYGPDPYDREAGEAAMAAARDLTDPVKVVAAFQRSLDEHFLPSVIPEQCATQSGTADCVALLEFLYALDADIDLDCGEPDGETVTCRATMTTALHEVLGSSPTVTTAVIVQHAGNVGELELELRFHDDPSIDEAFIAHAAAATGTFHTNGTPIYGAPSAPAWLAAAASFTAP